MNQTAEQQAVTHQTAPRHKQPGAIDYESVMNNNNIDKNGTLAITFDLIPRPFLYLVMYSIS